MQGKTSVPTRFLPFQLEVGDILGVNNLTLLTISKCYDVYLAERVAAIMTSAVFRHISFRPYFSGI